MTRLDTDFLDWLKTLYEQMYETDGDQDAIERLQDLDRNIRSGHLGGLAREYAEDRCTDAYFIQNVLLDTINFTLVWANINEWVENFKREREAETETDTDEEVSATG